MSRSGRSKVGKALIGTAGEYFVLYRLHLDGVMASLAPRNAPTVDVLVLNPDESVRASVQVKTRTTGVGGGWVFGQKHEGIENRGLFYALVDLQPDAPETYIVPSRVVARFLRRSHRAWLARPGRGGRPHKDNPVRRLEPAPKNEVRGFPAGWLDEYREGWELLYE